jgi:hypothetical protein
MKLACLGDDTMQSREFYIPARSRKVAMKDGGAVFYLYENGQRQPAAVCFIGKAQKPSWHFRFASPAQRERRIASTIERVQAHQARRAEERARKAAEAAKGHGWEPGLILVSSWGYEQTNVDFYEVVEVIGKTMVRIEKIGSQSATDAGEGFSSMSDHVVPNLEARSGEFRRCKVTSGHIRLASYCSASLWDGRPRYCSWYA